MCDMATNEKAENRKKDTLERIARFEETGESIDFETVDAWIATWGREAVKNLPVTVSEALDGSPLPA